MTAIHAHDLQPLKPGKKRISFSPSHERVTVTLDDKNDQPTDYLIRGTLYNERAYCVNLPDPVRDVMLNIGEDACLQILLRQLNNSHGRMDMQPMELMWLDSAVADRLRAVLDHHFTAVGIFAHSG